MQDTRMINHISKYNQLFMAEKEADLGIKCEKMLKLTQDAKTIFNVCNSSNALEERAINYDYIIYLTCSA